MKQLLIIFLLLFSLKINAFEIFRIEIQGNGYADETVIVFSETASDTFNLDEDSPKLFSPIAGVPGICTKVSGHYITIDQYSPLITDKVIEVVVKIQTAGIYTLFASQFSDIDPTSQIFLEDVQNNTLQDLRQNQNYTCQLGTGMIQSRFFLHFRAPILISTISPGCENNDGQFKIEYNSQDSLSATITNQNGGSICQLINFHGIYQKDSLYPGNYTVVINYSNAATTTTYFVINSNYPVVSQLQASSVMILPQEQVILMLNVINSTQNIWDFGDGTNLVSNYNNVLHTYIQPGQYQVSVISTNTICSDTSTIIITVMDVSSVPEIFNSNKFKNIIISDVLGRKVDSNDIHGLIFIFDGTKHKKVFID